MCTCICSSVSGHTFSWEDREQQNWREATGSLHCASLPGRTQTEEGLTVLRPSGEEWATTRPGGGGKLRGQEGCSQSARTGAWSLCLLLLRVEKQPPRDSCRCEELDKTRNGLVLLHVFSKNILRKICLQSSNYYLPIVSPFVKIHVKVTAI